MRTMSDRTLLPALASVLLLLAASLTGCNTVRGVGEDVEAAGDTISDVAADTKDELEDEDD